MKNVIPSVGAIFTAVQAQHYARLADEHQATIYGLHDQLSANGSELERLRSKHKKLLSKMKEKKEEIRELRLQHESDALDFQLDGEKIDELSKDLDTAREDAEEKDAIADDLVWKNNELETIYRDLKHEQESLETEMAELSANSLAKSDELQQIKFENEQMMEDLEYYKGVHDADKDEIDGLYDKVERCQNDADAAEQTAHKLRERLNSEALHNEGMRTWGAHLEHLARVSEGQRDEAWRVAAAATARAQEATAEKDRIEAELNAQLEQYKTTVQKQAAQITQLKQMNVAEVTKVQALEREVKELRGVVAVVLGLQQQVNRLESLIHNGATISGSTLNDTFTPLSDTTQVAVGRENEEDSFTLAARVDVNTVVDIGIINDEAGELLDAELIRWEHHTRGGNYEKLMHKLVNKPDAAAAQNCLPRRFTGATGGGEFTVNDRQKYACLTCTNTQKICCVWEDSKIVLLPLLPGVRNHQDSHPQVTDKAYWVAPKKGLGAKYRSKYEIKPPSTKATTATS